MGGLSGIRQQRQPLRVVGRHPMYHSLSHVVRRQIDREFLVKVLRPFRRAHPHQPRLGLRKPPATSFLDQLAPHLLPDGFGVDEDTIQIEHHGADHTTTIRRLYQVRERGSAGAEPVGTAAWPRAQSSPLPASGSRPD